jgi:hypothetical protein
MSYLVTEQSVAEQTDCTHTHALMHTHALTHTHMHTHTQPAK